MTPTKKQILVFGYGMALILSFIAMRLSVKFGLLTVPVVLFALAGGFAYTTARDRQRLVPVYEKWMIGARFIGQIISTVLLTVIFYFVFGAAGIILRLLRKDLLNLNIQPAEDSYWQERQQRPFDQERYHRQF